MQGSRLWALLFIAALLGCDGTSGSAGNAAFQIDTLDSGLVQVVNDGRGVWTPETAWRLEEDLRLGTVGGGGPEQFAQVAWILEDADGRIYILDYPDPLPESDDTLLTPDNAVHGAG